LIVAIFNASQMQSAIPENIFLKHGFLLDTADPNLALCWLREDA
jgi:hypothetical protein